MIYISYPRLMVTILLKGLLFIYSLLYPNKAKSNLTWSSSWDGGGRQIGKAPGPNLIFSSVIRVMSSFVSAIILWSKRYCVGLYVDKHNVGKHFYLKVFHVSIWQFLFCKMYTSSLFKVFNFRLEVVALRYDPNNKEIP